MCARRYVLLVAAARAWQSAVLPRPRLAPLRLFGRRGGDARYDALVVDVSGYEARSAPAVSVGDSPGRGRGVFAARAIGAGETATEYVGLLSRTPGTRREDLALYARYYGSEWRRFSQRYEIGLSGTAVADAGGVAAGGEVDAGVPGGGGADCAVGDGYAECVTRAGSGAYLLLGKVEGADPRDGVAQLINDHSCVRAPSAARARASDDDGGLIRPSDVDGLILRDGAWPYDPVAVDGAALRRSVGEYVAAIVPRTNCALVQARTGLGTGIFAPRVFAVATRPIAAGEELLLTYGAEWWLAHLRRAAIAQLVTCAPSVERTAALERVVRCVEAASCDAVGPQRAAVREAGCMPRGFAQALDPLAPFADLLGETAWRRALLAEEFGVGTECPVDYDALRETLRT